MHTDKMAKEMEREESYNRQVYFTRSGVQPPGNEYVTVDDVLILSFWSPTAASTVRLSVRVLTPDGVVDPRFEERAALTVGTTPEVLTLRNMEGFLLSAEVTTPDAPHGQVFVTLEIVRGRGSADLTRGAILLAGYPDLARAVGYPESPVRSSLDGPGLMRIVTGTAPAAGAEISETVPAGRQWVLNGLRVSFTTSAAVPVRDPALRVDDGGGAIPIEGTMSVNIAAAQTNVLSWAPDFVGFGILPGTLSMGFPKVRLLPGWRILTSTTGLDVADQYTAPVMLVEEFITG